MHTNLDNDRTPNIPARPMNRRGGFRYQVARTGSMENDFTAQADIPVVNGPISGNDFRTLLKLCRRPAAQIVVDYLDGIAYLISYDPEKAEGVMACNAEAERDYDRWRKRDTNNLSLDYILGGNEENTLKEHLASPDDAIQADENELFLQAVSYLCEKDRQFMLDYYAAGCNCAELARRYGMDKSSVAKRVKRLKERFLAALDAAKNFF